MATHRHRVRIAHLSSITHEGKVVVVGTGEDGTLHYTVKRSGFEDTALQEGAEMFGFEDWHELRLGESVADPSVEARERATVADASGRLQLRSLYGDADEVVESADAPVQLVSAEGLLHVFRWSKSSHRILVSRFVLDGMTNMLVPKLEVRFRRSRQRYAPHEETRSQTGSAYDNLDYRDMDGKSFYEPTVELGFAGKVERGWFSPVLVPTAESDRKRWHLFLVDQADRTLRIYSVGATRDGAFDVKDHLFGQRGAADSDAIHYRSVPGIVCRTLELAGLTVAGRPSATTYDVQTEIMTSTGPRLVRTATRLMLAVPVKAAGGTVRTAAIDFAPAGDGTLSRIAAAPAESRLVRSVSREVVTSLTLLDDIKGIATLHPPPSGTVVATARGPGDLLQVRSKEALSAGLVPKVDVRLRGTRSYDGLSRVDAVDDNAFTVAATPADGQAGAWEVVPAVQTGLVFDGMIVGCEETEDGTLRISCPAHDLQVGDEVQISGTLSYDGTFPVMGVDAASRSFVLGTPYFTGEAANLSKVVRRGLRLEGGADRVETPDLELRPPDPTRPFGRTLSAWVRVDAAGNAERHLVEDSGGMMRLSVGRDDQVKVDVRCSDGTTTTVADRDAIRVGAWTHYAAACGADETGMWVGLYRDGVEVDRRSTETAVIELRDAREDIVMQGSPDLANKSFTIEMWAKRSDVAEGYLFHVGVAEAGRCLHMGFRASGAFVLGFGGNDLETKSTYKDQGWHHWACTGDRVTGMRRIYRDGVEVASGSTGTWYSSDKGAITLGHYAGGMHGFRGSISHFRVWDRARSHGEIAASMSTRSFGSEEGLLAYWPLDAQPSDGKTVVDLSPARRNGTIGASPAWHHDVAPPFPSSRIPQIAPPARPEATVSRAMEFDGTHDSIEIPPFVGPTGALTVSVWAESATPLWNDHGCLVSKRGAFVLHPWKDERRISLILWSSNGTEARSDYAPASIEGWHHYAGTYDGKTMRLYVDGVMQAPLDRSGLLATSVSAGMSIGRDGDPWPTERRFRGRLADVQVWSVARSAAAIQASMLTRLTGKESGLVGYWPLDAADAYDLSPGNRPGRFRGEPRLVSVGSAFTIGKGLVGELSEVQVWEAARTASEVKATMHLQLTGQERALAADYRMGAIVHEQSGPVVPDFSRHGRSGVVYGEPYAGARRLDRASASGQAIRYGSDEVVAVSQRGVYEESLELRIIPSKPTVSPNDVGQGKMLFVFRYWGKTSRASREAVVFPAENVQMHRFEALGDGWWRASCRVVVPDGIGVMRAFEVADVSGSWTAIDIRKHRIRQISDAVTRDGYTDALALRSLPAQSQADLDRHWAVRQAERAVAMTELQIWDLLARIDVATHMERYESEKRAVEAELVALEKRLADAQREQARLVDDITSYWLYLRVKQSQKVADAYPNMSKAPSDSRLQQFGKVAGFAEQLFHLRSVGGGWFKILCKAKDGLVLTPRSDTHVDLQPERGDGSQHWRFVDVGGGYSRIESSNGKVLDVEGRTNAKDGAWLHHWAWENADDQRWARDRTQELTPSAVEAIRAQEALEASLREQIAAAQAHLAWLVQALGSTESLAELQRQLEAARALLDTQRTALATANTAFLGALTALPPASLPVVATDARALTTTGAVLDFAQPAGGVRLFEGCEGDVLLSYVDAQGRMRATRYDATADGRNAAFEQWLPDAVRACADVRSSTATITLPAQPGVVLPATGWTCEAWLRYPPATRSNGGAYEANVIAAGSGGDRALQIQRGNRLGLAVGSWFFDSGANLDTVMSAGWHHVAVSTGEGSAAFYVDGKKVGERGTQQSALRFDGKADRVIAPAHATPTAALSVSAWARSAGPTWNAHGCLVAKRDAFILHPAKGSRTIYFYVQYEGVTGWDEVGYAPSDIQGWHLYTGTFDGKRLCLYVDGELRAEKILATTRAIRQESTKTLCMGYDPGNGSSLAGDVAEVALWSRALNAFEIREQMARPLQGGEASLAGLWRMETVEEGGKIKVADLTASKRHADVHGAPADATVTTLRAMAVEVLGNAVEGGSPVGSLAEVRLWDLALSDAEIAVDAQVELTGNEPGLVAYWPLDETTGTTARDRAASGAAHGAMVGASWVGCTAEIGALETKRVLRLPDSGAYVEGPAVDLRDKSFTLECWARRSGERASQTQVLLFTGSSPNNTTTYVDFSLAYTSTSGPQLRLMIAGNTTTATVVPDTAWHHWCATYSRTEQRVCLYRDGEQVAERSNVGALYSSGRLAIGARPAQGTLDYFRGELAEVRVWDRALWADEIRANMSRRMTGTEHGLLTCHPLDEIKNHAVRNRVSGQWDGALQRANATMVEAPAVPVSPTVQDVVVAEYSAVELDAQGRQAAMMRRFHAYIKDGAAELLPEQRVEALVLQWVGNTQISPTLLGYIEGAPPVPSENLTEDADGYGGATSVTLVRSDETTYAWQRSRADEEAFDMETFLGLGWKFSQTYGSLLTGYYSLTSEGKVGAVGQYGFRRSDTSQSAINAGSSLTATDSLTLKGAFEESASSSALGRRWIPKNVGYALVVSGMADVFVTKLARSGRMVTYDIRPVADVPLDVNTITFLINPAYTLNGSLDGMVGSQAADRTFYGHVPALRAQHGSLYPASYFRLEEAYALKETIDRQDKEREAFFYNCDVYGADRVDAYAAQTPTTTVVPGYGGADEDSAALLAEQSEAAKDEAQKREDMIAAQSDSLASSVRASAAFQSWQIRMEQIQVKAGKHNIVNTYVWDGDGGLHAEEQGFASTVEHTLAAEWSHHGGGGMKTDLTANIVATELSLVGSGARIHAMSKTLSQGRSLSLSVDLGGVENGGITDNHDLPLLPGEKVDRYRMMSFYLEGATEHFHDFFAYVVDPEWLMSNDEEARALRQAQAAKPNKCWRVLHRVTYVERPALRGIR